MTKGRLTESSRRSAHAISNIAMIHVSTMQICNAGYNYLQASSINYGVIPTGILADVIVFMNLLEVLSKTGEILSIKSCTVDMD
jgi:hypothetical protein